MCEWNVYGHVWCVSGVWVCERSVCGVCVSGVCVRVWSVQCMAVVCVGVNVVCQWCVCGVWVCMECGVYVSGVFGVCGCVWSA